MTLPLEGLKVLDLTRYLPGEYCTGLLADMGADVLRVEQPGKDRKSALPLVRRPKEVEEREAAFDTLNRNKRSMTLNLKAEDGRRIFLALVAKADIVIESYRPGVAQRLGIDYPSLTKINSRLIYCAMSGYGQDGPYRDLPGHDINYLAVSGALSVLNEGGAGQPMVSGLKLADIGGGGLQAIIGVLLALLAREKTGRGQLVDIALTDGIMSWLVWPLDIFFERGKIPDPGEVPLAGKRPGFNVYETKDGKYISLGIREPHLFANFCAVLGRKDFAPDMETSGKRREEMIAELRKIFLTKRRDEWVHFFQGKDINFAPVNTPDEAARDPHLLHRKMVVEVDHPRIGKVKQVGMAIKLSDTPGQIRKTAPLVGENTEEVLTELGYIPKEIARLKRSGIIC
jgi:crotonobetainyl-CoA:carnitine CoA-transferase CaiB-like acyl-CoA transferase